MNGFEGGHGEADVFFSFSSFTYPGSIYRLDLATGKTTLWRQPKVDFDPAAFETSQVFAASKDGTKVPVFLVSKKGARRDGTSPALLTGYGGFDIAELPSFSVRNLAFVERGGTFALAILRGGSEYGEDWHRAGMLGNKQKVFDDFVAAGEWLVANKICGPKQLAITGGSNGGLLVGAVLNQRPDLFGAAVPAVGVMDMLRYHRFTIGWAWASEYGSSDDAAAFRWLYAYSPLHNIKEGRHLPADARDDRRPRRPRRPRAFVQVRRDPPGGAGRGCADPHPHRDARRPRRRQARVQTDRRDGGRAGVPREDGREPAR